MKHLLRQHAAWARRRRLCIVRSTSLETVQACVQLRTRSAVALLTPCTTCLPLLMLPRPPHFSSPVTLATVERQLSGAPFPRTCQWTVRSSRGIAAPLQHPSSGALGA
eukprot:6175717-Pleurochrysis_carterae.AAC.2